MKAIDSRQDIDLLIEGLNCLRDQYLRLIRKLENQKNVEMSMIIRDSVLGIDILKQKLEN